MDSTAEMSAKEMLNDFRENYTKIRKLIDEDSKNDPANDPYCSKYKAKTILLNMCETLKKLKGSESISDLDGNKLDAMLGTVLLYIGIVDMETEELAASEKVLLESVEILAPIATKPYVVISMINVYNNLGILACHRDEPAKAKTYLLEAKELYENFKCTLQIPLSIDLLINNAVEADVDDFIHIERAYTHSLYYLAQVYGSLSENLKSAIYCHVTLRRQLSYKEHEPIEWSLNAATLSQYFAEQNGFYQSRHHLAAASKILEDYGERLQGGDNSNEVHLANLERLSHRSADVARCWAKYCILLMTASKNRLMDDSERLTEAITDMSNLSLEDDENICGGDIKSLIFPDLDVSTYENKITDKFLLTYQDAREVFLCCQTWLNKAKEYYKLDTLASDYIQIIQDSSLSYCYLAFFEEDDERRAKMHKRRVDMLEDLIKEINPLYYLQYCRQIWFELGEAYSDILNLKLEKFQKNNEKPTPHALKKINMLCEKSIENYDNFLNSVRDKNGVMPARLDNDLIRPVISALAFIGRNSMKRIALDKSVELRYVKKSRDSYQAVVDICKVDKNAAAMMAEEFSLCQEMANILPIKIQRMESEMLMAGVANLRVNT